MLPGIDGLEICRRMAADSGTRRIPIIMLTAKSEEADMVAGLELGADDYITKPFSPVNVFGSITGDATVLKAVGEGSSVRVSRATW